MRPAGSISAARAFTPSALALAVAYAFGIAPPAAQAQPSGAVAVHGTVSLSQPAPQQLLVTTTNGAGTGHSVVNWQSFSIPGGSLTHIAQPGASSLSINRVVTASPSLIYGTLSSNGQVLLVNPAGITVGAGAVVDTAGFLASTLPLGEADAIAGRLRFEGAGGELRVEGQVVAREGDVVLVAPQVTVEAGGVVRAPNGSVVLAAGQKAEITGRGLEGIQLQVQAPGDRALNLGTLSGDAVGIFAGTLKHSGVIQASAVSTEGGRVVLKATESAEIGGLTRAERLERLGGLFEATARTVEVTGEARVDVSGEAGGGQAYIGGGWQGQDARIANAQTTRVHAGAQVNADATGQGDGGTVVVWADGTTRYEGHISARGGDLGGDGGRVEVSGKQWLGFGGTVDTRAPLGQRGLLLLDPEDIVIGTTVDLNGDSTPGDDVTGLGIDSGDNPGATSQITAAMVSALLNSTDLSLAATNNITVDEAISATGGNQLTLNAVGGDITIDAAVTNGGDLVFTAGNAIVFNAPVTTTGSSSVIDLTAGAGGISQGPGGALSTQHVLYVDSGDDVSLTNAGNHLPGLLVTAVGTVDIATGASQTWLNGVSATGAVNLSTTGQWLAGGTVSGNGITLQGSSIGQAASPVVLNPGAGAVSLTATGTSAGAGIHVRQATGTAFNAANYTIVTDAGTTQTVKVSADAVTLMGGSFFGTGSAGLADDDIEVTALVDDVLVPTGATLSANSLSLLATGAAGNVQLGTPVGTITLNMAAGVALKSYQGNVIVNNTVNDGLSGSGFTLAAANDVALNAALNTTGGDITITAGKTGTDAGGTFAGTAGGSITSGGNLSTTTGAVGGDAGNVTLTVEGAAGTLEIGTITTSGADAATNPASNAGNVTISVGNEVVSLGAIGARGGNGSVFHTAAGAGGAVQIHANTGNTSTLVVTFDDLDVNTSGGSDGGTTGTGGAAGSVELGASHGLVLTGATTILARSGNGGTATGDAGATAPVLIDAGAGNLEIDGDLDVNNAAGTPGTGGQSASMSATTLKSTGGAIIQTSGILSTNGEILKFSAQGAVTLDEATNDIGEVDGTAGGNVAISGLSGVGDGGITTTAGTLALTGQASNILNIQGPLSAPGDITLTGDAIEVQDPVVSSGGNVTVTGNDIWIRAIPGTPSPAPPSGIGSLAGATITLNAPIMSVDGKLYPGGSGGVGSVVVNGALSMHSGSELHIDFHGANHDTMDASGGSVAFDSGAKIVTAAVNLPAIASYALVSGTTSGTLPTLSGAVQGTLRFGSLYLDVSSAPAATAGAVDNLVQQFTELFTSEVDDPVGEGEPAQDDIVIDDVSCRPR